MSDNREVQRIVAIYRNAERPAEKLDDGSFSIPGQAYADVLVELSMERTMFLMIPIENVKRLRDDLDDVLRNHKVRAQ